MPLVLHLSDLHLLGEPGEQDAILTSLIAAIGKERERRGRAFDLVVITGDVFDSATLDASAAVREFEALHACVQRALGGPVPTIVVPGNHDRRRLGLFGPHRDHLFRALRDASLDQLIVHGCDAPFLAKVIPHEAHRQPLWAIAYDSTYLPTGYLSAGGVIRQEDLLHAAAEIGGEQADWPVLFLLHHHLVPTPLTDLGEIETHRVSAVARAVLHRMLPVLVAHADREELTMTALGAGTALSTLHLMNRAVLVLHGHKHYASARKLEGIEAGQGDVLLVSAGSSGTAQRWSPTEQRDVARLWPSFNVIQLDDRALTIEAVAFGWKGRSAAELAYRPLVWAEREGARWAIAPIEGLDAGSGPRLEENESRVTLSPSARHAGRWDYEIERRVRPGSPAPKRYVETIEGLPGARLEWVSPGGRAPREVPAQIELGLDPARPTRLFVEGGTCRTFDEAAHLLGPSTSPFEWVGLMNRYRAGVARLIVDGLGDRARTAFASATDLGTGQERPIAIARDAGRVVVERERCAPRTLLRIYWPLDR